MTCEPRGATVLARTRSLWGVLVSGVLCLVLLASCVGAGAGHNVAPQAPETQEGEVAPQSPQSALTPLAADDPGSPQAPAAATSSAPRHEVKENLSAYRWEELAAISSEIAELSERNGADAALRLAAAYHLCAEDGLLSGMQPKQVTLTDGTQASVRLIGIAHDHVASSTRTAGLTFMFCGCVAEYAMNSGQTNRGGWEASELRAWLNDGFLKLLPEDLRAALTSVSKFTANSNNVQGVPQVTPTSDAVWLPSVVELVGEFSLADYVQQGGDRTWYQTYYGSVASEGRQYRYFAEGAAPLLGPNPSLQMPWLPTTPDLDGFWKQGDVCGWWERTPVPESTRGFYMVDQRGNPLTGYGATDLFGVVPCFCV